MPFRRFLLAAAAMMALSAPAHAQIIIGATIGSAPPAVRYAPAPAPRSGYIWAPGYWDWIAGRYLWVEGRWLAERPGYVWVSDDWAQYGDGWRRVHGHWAHVGGDAVPGHDVRDYRGGPQGDRGDRGNHGWGNGRPGDTGQQGGRPYR